MFVVNDHPVDFLSVFNSSPDNYLLLKPDAPRFTIIASTDSYNRVTNSERNEITGLGIFEAFTDNPANAKATGVKNLRASLFYVLQNKKSHALRSQRYDIYALNKIFFEFKVWDAENFPVLDKNGEVEYIIHSVKDVTELARLEEFEKKAKEEAEDQRQQLHNLFIQAPCAITMLEGPDFRVRLANKQALKYWGKTHSEIINKPISEMLPGAAGQGYQQILTKVYKTGERFVEKEQPFELMRNGKRENGFIHLVCTPYYSADNCIEGIMAMANEVTEQVQSREKIANWAKELEIKVQERTRELSASNFKLQQINRELEQFAYAASHDLQEPLRKIYTFTQLLENSLGEVNDKSRIYLDKVYASSARMIKLIKDILTFSQLSYAKEKFRPVDLNELIEDIRTDFELVIEQKGAAIECFKLPVVEAISVQMNQLFTNLISNALKFCSKNLKPVITITASRVPKEDILEYTSLNPEVSYYIIQVRDNGIGFDQANADKIFNIFQRLHPMHQYEGTGIGLALCQKIVLNHHGDIYATSTPGHGAVFNVILPEKQVI